MKKSYILLLALIFVAVFAKLTNEFFTYNLLDNDINKRDEKNLQARIYLKNLEQLLQKIDFKNSECINNIEFENDSYKFKVEFEYFSKKQNCKKVITSLNDDKEFVIAHLFVSFEKENIRIYKRILMQINE